MNEQRRSDGPFISGVEERLAELARDLPPASRSLIADLISQPGKGVRPRLLYACAALGSPSSGRLVRAGAVVELVHLASLLHDDVIDRAELRRGLPAAHVVAGHEQAMLAGLACFACAGKEAADLGPAVNDAVSRSVAALAYGEMLDVERAFDVTFPADDYEELVARKTGELFRLACALGALEGGLRAEAAVAVAEFGLRLGVAFQVLDDCLDLDLAARDKPAGTDLLLGLFGAPVLFALRSDSSRQLASVLLDPALSVADLPFVASLVERLGGLAAARELAVARYREAVAELASVPGTVSLLEDVDSLWRSLR
ncbi:polyprenyl synthetase family protein [Flindersiella endophytica]